MKFAWLADRSTEPDIDWWNKTLGPSRLRILEIGCGNGSNLKTFEQLGHDVTGVEPDAVARQVAEESGLRVFAGTAEDLPKAFSDGKYDVIVFMHVLEHCIRPDAAVRNARNLLRKGGKIVAEVPNNACTAAEFFGTTWYWLDVPRHVNFFTTKSLQSLFSENGIKPVQTVYRGYCRHFSPSWMSTQALIGDRICSNDAKRSGSDYWRYLTRSAFASADRKYDSVRVVGSTD
jgi:SAM-dependent methyltransferase